MKQNNSRQPSQLRTLAEVQAAEEEIYRHQIHTSFTQRPGETWIEMNERKRLEDGE